MEVLGSGRAGWMRGTTRPSPPWPRRRRRSWGAGTRGACTTMWPATSWDPSASLPSPAGGHTPPLPPSASLHNSCAASTIIRAACSQRRSLTFPATDTCNLGVCTVDGTCTGPVSDLPSKAVVSPSSSQHSGSRPQCTVRQIVLETLRRADPALKLSLCDFVTTLEPSCKHAIMWPMLVAPLQDEGDADVRRRGLHRRRRPARVAGLHSRHAVAGARSGQPLSSGAEVSTNAAVRQPARPR